MTFLCGPDLVADVPHAEYEPGRWGWPRPWALRCNGCGTVFDYATIAQTGADVHTCEGCQHADRSGQLTLAVGV